MRLVLALALFVSVTAPAAAQDRGSSEVTEYTFEDDLVNGGRYEPDGATVYGDRRRPRQTLIRARAHFIPEMLVSVERL